MIFQRAGNLGTLYWHCIIFVEPPPGVSMRCNESDLGAQVPLLVSDVLEEASVVLQDLVSESLSSVLRSRVLGRLQEHPASSCEALLAAGVATSDYYWLRAGNGSAVRVYCDLTSEFAGMSSHGFMRAAHLDMDQPLHNCPASLRTLNSSCGARRLCGRGQSSPGCSSVTYSIWGIPFQRVCGRVIGFQFSSTNAFLASQYDPSLSLEEAYLDGVSLTYGHSPRHHIWSFAAGLAESAEDYSGCPCGGGHDEFVATVPAFVQGKYFCASGNHYQALQEGGLYCDHPLWDGEGCGSGSTCCQRQNHSAWFCSELDERVNSDLELRLCGNEEASNEDTPLQSVELYVQ